MGEKESPLLYAGDFLFYKVKFLFLIHLTKNADKNSFNLKQKYCFKLNYVI